MRAMVLERTGTDLVPRDVPDPRPAAREVLVEVRACGVCRTDLHVRDGELTGGTLPVILGHEIVGTIRELGSEVTRLRLGDRVGVGWLGAVDGTCELCRSGRENLCPNARFTGHDRDGGYAQLIVADERFAFPLASDLDDAHVAPLMCAGVIGHRALRASGDARRIGIYGFGAAAHIVTQIATFEGREVYAFTRPGDVRRQAFARDLGAVWAGGSEERPVALDAAIVFAPVGALVPTALASLRPGGTVVCAGIHMSDIPAFPYALLWAERSVCSVANLTRRDGDEFLALAARVPLRTTVRTYALDRANDALSDLRRGSFEGAAVLVPDRRGA